MADAEPNPTDADTSARITDADIERARAQIGIPQPSREVRHERVPSANGISHFAFSYGDDNPLWHDDDYARSTRWRGRIAPPAFLNIAGVNPTPPFDPEKKALFRGLFRGVGEYHSGSKWEFYRPVVPAEPVYYHTTVASVDVRESSKFSGGRSVHLVNRMLYADRAGLPLGVNDNLMVHAERGGSKKADKHADIRPAQYTDADIAHIDSIYAAEIVRGAVPRWWEDVQVGDALQPLAKGPMLVTEIIADHLGRGMGHYSHGPLRYWWKTRQRMPNFYTRNANGVPDVVQRLHWEQDWASRLGLPMPYDYGFMRTRWMIHVATHWMGDDAWLWRFHDEIRAFNFLGDWHLMEGRVTDKRRDGLHCVVDLALTGTDQRGRQTCRATATVILPSREFGPAILPPPPQEHLGVTTRLVAGAALDRGAAPA
ncbi:MAG: MaoC family dehydratase N-terminal domain-containing protein [Gammaproteobacteria bacterium]